MPKSYEDIYPWHDANKWGITASADVLKWALKTWDEGLKEGEADYKGLVDFIATMDATHTKLRHKSPTKKTAGATAGTSTGAGAMQKWHLQKSASDYWVKIELRPVLAQFKANLSFPTPGMSLSGL